MESRPCPIGKYWTVLEKAHIHSRGAHPELKEDPDNVIDLCHTHHRQTHDGFLAVGKGSCQVTNRLQAARGGFQVIEGPEAIREHLQSLRKLQRQYEGK